MKLSKFVKRMTALAMCGIMCMGSVVSADEFSNPRYVVDDSGIALSRTYIDRSRYSYSMETIVAKDYAGRNMYNSNVSASLIIRDTEVDTYTTRRHSSNVYAGYTTNPKIGYTYTDYIIVMISATVTTSGRSISIRL